MSARNPWVPVTLYDLNGNICARVRVPKEPKQPGIILWGVRYFKQRGITSEYIESAFFMVPIESMYPASNAVPGPHESERP